MAPPLNTTRARQGRAGKPILWVLGISMVGAILVLFGSWIMKSDDLSKTTEPNTSHDRAAAASFDAPEPTPRQNESTPPLAR